MGGRTDGSTMDCWQCGRFTADGRSSGDRTFGSILR